MRLNTTVVAPMPSASVRTAMTVKPGFFSNWRRANLRSFITQCLKGLDFGGASSGNEAGNEGCKREEDCDRDESQRIGWFDFVKKVRQKPAKGEGANGADRNSGENGFHSVTDEQTK